MKFDLSQNISWRHKIMTAVFVISFKWTEQKAIKLWCISGINEHANNMIITDIIWRKKKKIEYIFNSITYKLMLKIIENKYKYNTKTSKAIIKSFA